MAQDKARKSKSWNRRIKEDSPVTWSSSSG